MPVDQAGEEVLFVVDGTEIETHVRIQYEGEAERFAWVVPLLAVPEVSVGSDALFDGLASLAAARTNLTRTCDCAGNDCWEEDDDGGGGQMFLPAVDVGGGHPPTIVLQEVVGAFDVTVLAGGDASEVIAWLDDNGYQQDAEAEPILAEYLEDGYIFAAIKLVAGAASEEVHPIVFRQPGDEPCIPLKLTRIAAEQDMTVAAYHLGTARLVPRNYAHVVRNPLRATWLADQATEMGVEVLAMAVDEAGGHAFATDYAGPSAFVGGSPIYSPDWDEAAFATIDPIDVVDELQSQGLLSCPSEVCTFANPQIQSLLLHYLPPPPELEPSLFWLHLDYYADFIDLEAWDGPAFAADMEERVVEPGLHAIELLETWPYLTRLVTTISPIEMTLDPTFTTNADLPDELAAFSATQTIDCDDESLVEVSDGHRFCLAPGRTWAAWGDDMPWALRVEKVPTAGPPQVVLDNADAIDDAVAKWNEKIPGCALAEGGNGGGGEDEDDDAPSGPVTELQAHTEVGCACTSTAGDVGRHVLSSLLVFPVLAAARRRRVRGTVHSTRDAERGR